ncbi:MAG: glycosyltransferase family 4 protein [Candidatus Omnitrophota bacterium]
MKILFLTQTTQIGPASRYRVYQYLDYLKQEDIQFEVSPSLNSRDYNHFYLSCNPRKKIFYTFKIFFRRFVDLFRIKKFDFIFIQREILPQIFPFFEIIYSKLNKNLIFDFDDAIYLVPPQRNSILYKFRDKKSIERILKLSKVVIAGNEHLKEFAQQYNQQVRVIPTSINITIKENNRRLSNLLSKDRIVIGWIGSIHTVFYLNLVADALKILSKRYKIVFHTIGAGPFKIKGVDVINKEWAQSTELFNLSLLDIGIAPLYDDAWAKGKCGLKALQYMACGIVCVCSNAGIYKQMIRDADNGFLARNTDEWVDRISRLIENSDLRKALIESALRDVQAKYSIEKNKYKFREIFS